MLNGFQLQLDPSQIFTLLASKDVLSGAFNNVANGARLTTNRRPLLRFVNYGAGSPYGANNLVLSDPQAVPEPASLTPLCRRGTGIGIRSLSQASAPHATDPRSLLFIACVATACFTASSNSSAADFSAIWDVTATGGRFSPLEDANPTYPNNTGAITYDATINGGNVTLDRNITVQRLFLNSFTNLIGASELTLNEGLTWTNGYIGNSISSAPTINLAAGSTSTISTANGGAAISGIINNFGTVTQTGDFDFTGIINNPAGATWNLQGGGMNNPRPFVFPGYGGTFNNAGNLVVSPTQISSGRAGVSVLTSFNNTGNITIQAPAKGVETTFTLVGPHGTGDGSFNVGADCILILVPIRLMRARQLQGQVAECFGGHYRRRY